MDDNCIFCKIIKGDIPSSKVYEDDNILAFLDINPQSTGHTLVIPKYHAAKNHELPVQYQQALGQGIGIVSKALVAFYNDKLDYNILQNNGSGAGQEVFHVHYHIIPKTSNDEGLKVKKWTQIPFDGPKLSSTATKIQSFINK